MKRIIKYAAVVFTAAILACSHANASDIIIDAKTGEKYEDLDKALEENVVHEDDIEVTIPATKEENTPDYNNTTNDSDVQIDAQDTTTETKVKKDAKPQVMTTAIKKHGFVAGLCFGGIVIIVITLIAVIIRFLHTGYRK